MKYLIDTNGNYYEAEKNINGATEVQKRPSVFHSWNGSVWVLNQAAFDADALERNAQEVKATAIAQAKATAKADSFVQQFTDMTPAQLDAYIEENLKTLPNAKDLLKKLALIVLATAKEQYK